LLGTVLNIIYLIFIASDEEEEIMMETKSINTHSVAVRQKLNFLDDSYENDDSKNESIQQMFDIASDTHKQSSDKNTESSLVNNFCDKSSNTENSIGTNLNEESGRVINEIFD
jgi:hypothetical protein